MRVDELVAMIAEMLAEEDSVEGVFLSGSLVTRDRDRWSDIDLGIASGNTKRDDDRTYALRGQLLGAAGRPVHTLERGWGHCRMIAALYGRDEFPPIGLEIDLIFSRLAHVSEQMPFAPYRVLFDRTGRLRRALERMGSARPKDETRLSFKDHVNWLPFYVHDALKAFRRGDRFHAHSLVEEMRKLLFFAAAVRHGAEIHGSKRAHRHLTESEREVVASSYRTPDRGTVRRLAQAYVSCLERLAQDHGIEGDVQRLREVLGAIL